MSLKGYWNDYRADQIAQLEKKAKVTNFWLARLKEAFYAGADGALAAIAEDSMWRINEEIEHFNNRPKKAEKVGQ